MLDTIEDINNRTYYNRLGKFALSERDWKVAKSCIERGLAYRWFLEKNILCQASFYEDGEKRAKSQIFNDQCNLYNILT